MKKIVILASLLVIFTAGEAFSQGVAAPATTAPAGSGAATGMPEAATTAVPVSPKETNFNQKYLQLLKLGEQIRDLQAGYRTANQERQYEILQQAQAIYQQTEALFQEMSVLGLDLYKKDKVRGNVNLNTFLIDLIYYFFQKDDYEQAYILAHMLWSDGLHVKHPELMELTGVAAFMVNLFSTAEKCFDMAKGNDKLSQDGAAFEQRLGYYKTAFAKEEALQKAEAEADDLPRVLITTNKGPILVELFENEAPNTVANFISLVQKGYYDGLTFHRVIPEFVIQGGCPTGDGTGGPGYTIPCETNHPNARQHFRGSLSMAHAGKDTGGSQFFICLVPTNHLDKNHTVFGRVIEDKSTLAKINRVDPQNPVPGLEPDKILKMEVKRKRPGVEYKPQTIPGSR